MDRVKLRVLAVAANSAGCTFAESDGSLDSEECCAWEIADEAMHDSLTPEALLDLLDALDAADVKNTLLSACLHKAEAERDRLQVALSFWMPAIASEDSADGERCANDAVLLIGLDAHGSDCWGDRVLAEHKAARAELQNIVDADIRNFVALDPNHEFRLWAQSRARHTLALKPA